ncbi:MAG: hypothetical protein IPJ19_18925 [Planctomycetes bacterium]|nr:hypothetical protein [Planctomycetota bacterium]
MCTTSQADGSFHLDNVRHGIYALCASTRDGRCALIASLDTQVRSNVEDVQLSLQPAARLKVRYEGRHARGTLQLLQAGTLLDVQGIAPGPPAQFSAPAGNVELVLTLDGSCRRAS